MPVDMYIPPAAGCVSISCRSICTYSAWGFCRFARSTTMGNAKASTSGTSNGTALTLFLFLQPLRRSHGSNKSEIVKYLHFNLFRHLILLLGVYSICFLATTTTTSCASAKTFALSCQERQIEIYVDDEYLGRDLVYYTVPKGREYIEISCRDNGIEVYHRRINVKSQNGNLIELQIPKNYKYSNKPY